MQDLKIGLVQTHQHWEDKAANYTHFEAIFKKHLEGKDADLILLPEMFNTSFTMNAHSMAETMDGEAISWLKKQAALLKCQLGASLIIKEEGHFYNRFVIVNETEVLAYYNKRHLFRMAGENEFFSPGEERVVYELNGWRILLLVCYDLRFPVFSRNHFDGQKQDYDLMIYIANWPEKRSYAWKNLIQARAIENQAFCLGLNRVGKDGNDIVYSGDSAIYDPWGNPELQCTPSQEVIQIQAINYEKLEDIRQKFPAYLDAD